MEKIHKLQGFILFYVLVACLTYALIMRVDNLTKHMDEAKTNRLVLNLWCN